MFYEFEQNNSGGYFVTNKLLCNRIYIEADELEEAIIKAEELGCYWNGVSKGIDCECCGDRWHIPSDSLELPTSYKVGGYRCKDKDEWTEAYGKYTIVEEPIVKSGMFGKYYEGKIKFNSIEEYVQFLADEYHGTIPDARIYYKNGKIKEICKNVFR